MQRLLLLIFADYCPLARQFFNSCHHLPSYAYDLYSRQNLKASLR